MIAKSALHRPCTSFLTLAVSTVLVLAGCGDDGSAGASAGTDGAGTDTDVTGGTDNTTDTTTDGSTGGTTGATDSGGSGTTTGGTSATTDTSTTGDPGDPLPEGPAGEWIWVDIAGAKCRDGSQAGLAVRYSDTSDDVVIYFEGGGACYNSTTCLGNPSSVEGKGGKNSGILNKDDPANPVQDWNAIHVPYCTGDVFAGNNPGGNVPGGPQNQQFVGFVNTTLMLDRIVATFPNAADVVFTGVSAGGFGAAYNYDQAQQIFGSGVNVILVDDSGPPMDDPYMTPCLQQGWRDVWGLDATLPADCAECFHSDGGGLVYLTEFYSTKYPDRTLALISSEQDSTIRGFFGYGENDCNTVFPNMSGAKFEEGLYDLRDNWLAAEANWGTYFIEGSTHTWVGSDSRFYGTDVSGVNLAAWVADVIAGSPSHVAP